MSFDTPAENGAFKAKSCYPFPLLCDTNRALGMAYGACAEPGAAHAMRITVVVDPHGKVQRVYPQVSARTHADDVLADLKADASRRDVRGRG